MEELGVLPELRSCHLGAPLPSLLAAQGALRWCWSQVSLRLTAKRHSADQVDDPLEVQDYEGQEGLGHVAAHSAIAAASEAVPFHGT